MKRADYITHLRELHRAGGLAAILPLVEEAIVRQGPVHDEEWHECSGCGAMVEGRRTCEACAREGRLRTRRRRAS